MTEETQSGISRRTLAAGVAWATPAVAVAAAAPAYAASVMTTTTTPAPCIAEVVNTSASWVVGGAHWDTVNMHGCTCGTHRDVRLKFTVSQGCDSTSVRVRVRPINGAATWCRFNTPGNEAWLTKTATKVGGVWTYPMQGLFANPTGDANDGLYFPASGDNLGDCTGQRKNQTGGDNDNDGMHLNPCVNGPYAEYQVSLDGGVTWLPGGNGTYKWGSGEGRLSQCAPVPGNLTITKNDACATTVTWSAVPGATSYEVRYSTNTSGGGWSGWTTVTGTTHTYNTPNDIRRVEVRVSGTTDATQVQWTPTATVSNLTATRNTTPNPDVYTLTWDAIPGATYTVQRSTNASGGGWSDVNPGTLNTSGGTTTFTFTSNTNFRSVRVRPTPCGVQGDWTTATVTTPQGRGSNPEAESEAVAESETTTAGVVTTTTTQAIETTTTTEGSEAPTNE